MLADLRDDNKFFDDYPGAVPITTAQQAFNTMMGQMPSENKPFSNTSAFSQGTPFPYTNPTMSPPTTSSVTVDVPTTKVEAKTEELDVPPRRQK
ncbi:hypothetical protein IFM89_028952 [Coptis chinensis]|uniref:Uncharacterized protein n=1 Tax=Coptis chinensis TaxID=261450 RepID=A0A835LGW8_9MAGN|nr:hypothetical protein IFM89_028952 [Coptis chinensis]